MIVLSFDADGRGRPVITLFLAAGAPRIAALETLGEAPPAPVEVRALVDTGASRTTVQKSVLDRLGLDPVGADSLYTASTGKTPKEVDAYAVQLFFAGVPGRAARPGLAGRGGGGPGRPGCRGAPGAGRAGPLPAVLQRAGGPVHARVPVPRVTDSSRTTLPRRATGERWRVRGDPIVVPGVGFG
ncbi:MAG: aspartyl protease family protein [Planctomycetaceae bacterium]|nr:aspartyl protease family protein [Planctomycetaceae bacterium]